MRRPTSSRTRRLRTSVLAAAALVAAAGAAAVAAGGEPHPATTAIDLSRSNIATVRIDGTGLRRLTAADEGLRYDSPAWSRTGRWIAFSGPPCDDCQEVLFLIDLARGGRVSRLRGPVPGAARPSWGPSDRALTYVGGLTNSVFTIRRDGTGQRRLTNGRVAHDQSVWSPGGGSILFTSQQPNGHWDLSVMRSDGSRKRNLTATAVSEEQPAWSHDGRRIAFARQIGGRWAIYVMPAAGGIARRLTPTTDNSQQPAWSPDDRRIAYTRLTASGSSIVIMRADGTGRRRLRTGSTPASSPTWSPDGLRIAFSLQG